MAVAFLAMATHPTSADSKSAPTTTRRALYAQMVVLIYEKGYHSSSLRELGRRVGIQMPSIYYHYSSKQQLLLEIMVQTMEDLTKLVEASVANAGEDVGAQVQAAMAAHIAFHTERRREAYIVDSELRSLDLRQRRKITAMRDNYERVFAGLLERGAAEGRFGIDDVSLAVKALMAMCTEVSVWYRPDGRLSLADITDAYTRLFLYGVCSR